MLVFWLFVCPALDPGIDRNPSGAEDEYDERGEKEGVGGLMDKEKWFEKKLEIREFWGVGGR